MITHSFIFLEGIGEKTEQALWEKGITDWKLYEHYVNCQKETLRTRTIQKNIVTAREAISQNNWHFFADRLPQKEYYRIALTNPENVLFLHIETTGKSTYYNNIISVGWSLGKESGVHFSGQKKTTIISALQKAHCIIFTNFTGMDREFLTSYLMGDFLPVIQIPLLNLIKQSGEDTKISLLQKKLDAQYTEYSSILWHRYKKGDAHSLSQLIKKQYGILEKLKKVTKEYLQKVCTHKNIPASLYSTPNFPVIIKDSPHNLPIPTLPTAKESHITYANLQKHFPLESIPVAGIDLVASEKKASGVCLLHGNHVQTSRVYTDDEMIAQLRTAQVQIACIDSPLGLPQGRKTCWDDDPTRQKFGIIRECEKILRKRGVSIYPSLIPCMQKLTYRGIRLAKKLQHAGILVLESYPGGVQDILHIPRKQAGEEFLVEGLRDFGLTGEFVAGNVSHDELDAIYAALTAFFYLTNTYEKLGNDIEGFLYLPQKQISLRAENLIDS